MTNKPITNIRFVTNMMNFSRAGALKQAFIIEAIAQYSQQQLDSGPWPADSMISEASWKLCALECKAAIDNRNKS